MSRVRFLKHEIAGVRVVVPPAIGLKVHGAEFPLTERIAYAGEEAARSTVYYLPRPVSAADLELMRQIDRLHLKFPFAGARMLRGLLAANGSRRSLK